MVCFWYFNFILVFMVFLVGSSVFIVVKGLAWAKKNLALVANLAGVISQSTFWREQ